MCAEIIHGYVKENCIRTTFLYCTEPPPSSQDTGAHYVTWAGPELLNSSNLPSSASLLARTTGTP